MLSLEIIVVLLLTCVNGLLVMAEFAVISARKTRLQQLAEEGNRSAKSALSLANEPTSFLASIQVGITLISVCTSAFGGAKISEHVAVYLKDMPYVGPYAPQVAFGVVVVVIAYVTLIIGELVPKRIALNRAESMALLLARPLVWFSALTRPVVRLLSLSTDFFVGVVSPSFTKESNVTEEELTILVEQGTAEGVFEKVEESIFKRVLRLGDKRVADLMTPRPKNVVIDLSDDHDHSVQKMMESPHSYFPVYEENPDQVVGLISVKELWSQYARGLKIDLRSAVKAPLYVMENFPALKVLELFKQSGKHIAVVIDEYGGTAGLITIIDVFEAIVGDLPGTEEPMKSSIIRRKDGSWLVDGMISIDDFRETFKLKAFPNEKLGGYQTLGGMVMSKLGRIPREADQFTWEGFRFEVVDMDGLRVDKVLVASARGKERPR